MRIIIFCLTILFIPVMVSFSGKGGFSVTSTAFTENGYIPARYTCEGDNINPPLKITGAPAGTKSFALILHDPDAPHEGGYTHWVMWNIDTKGDIGEYFKGADQGLNTGKRHGYISICPPSGTHHYHFMVYALDTKLILDHTTHKEELEKAMEGHILAKTELVGLYKKVK